MTLQERKELLGIKAYSGSGEKNPFDGEQIIFTITNTGASAEPRLIAICPGWHTSASAITDSEGNVADATIDDGQIISTADKVVSVAGKNCKIINIQRKFATTPLRVKGFKIKVDDAAQLDEEIQFLTLTNNLPKLQDGGSIVPASAKMESENDTTLASISLLGQSLILGPNRTMVMNIAASRTVTVTMFVENTMSFRDQLEALYNYDPNFY